MTFPPTIRLHVYRNRNGDRSMTKSHPLATIDDTLSPIDYVG